MITNIDYAKLAIPNDSDEVEVDPLLRSRVWALTLVGLSAFWCAVALFVWIIS
jgi:hypothetical protein